ncbi:Ig-like domain-containing protein, partial [Gallibacterium anatis]
EWTATFTPSSNHTGSGSIQVKADSYTDAAGNKGGASNAVNIAVDTVAPQVTINIDQNKLNITKDSTEFTLTFDEAPYDQNGHLLTTESLRSILSLTKGLQIKSLTSASEDGTVWKGVISADPDQEISDAKLSIENYFDKAGNLGNSTESTLSVDTVSPTIEIYPIAQDKILNQAELDNVLTINGRSSAEKGQPLVVSLNGKEYETLIGDNGVWSVKVSPSDLADLNKETYEVTAKVTDVAGNESQSKQNIEIDKIAPNITQLDVIEPILSTATPTSQVNIHFSERPYKADGQPLQASDIQDLLSINGLNNDDYEITQIDNPSQDGITWVASVVLKDGALRGNLDKEISVVLSNNYYDQAGNKGNVQQSELLKVDTKAPSVTVDIENATLSTAKTSIEVNLNFTEAPYGKDPIIAFTADQIQSLLSLPDSYNGKLEFGVFSPVENSNSLQWKGSIQLIDTDTLIKSSDINVTVSDEYYDQAGNKGSGNTTTIAVDNYAEPDTLNLANFEDTGKDKGDKITSDDSFRLEVNGAEDGSRITYERSSDNQNWVSTDDNQAGLAEDTYYYRGKVVDKAGNEAYTASVAVTVDKHAEPGTLSLKKQDTGVAGDGVTSNDTFRLSVNDKEADSTVVYQRFEDGAWQNTEAGQSNLADGTYRYRAQITDKAGNVAETEEQSITIDKTAPTATVTIEDTVLSTTHPTIRFTVDFSEEPYDANGKALTAAQIKDLLALPDDKVTIGELSRVENSGHYQWQGSLTLASDIGSVDSQDITLTLNNGYYDRASNQGKAATDQFAIDTTPPTITFDVLAQDGVLNSVEKGTTLIVSGTTTAEMGQTVTVTLNGKPYLAAVGEGGKWSTNIPGADLADVKVSNDSIQLKAIVSDRAGNLSIETPYALTVDTKAPTATIAVTADTVLSTSHTETEFTITFTEQPYNSNGKALVAEDIKALLSLDWDVVKINDQLTRDQDNPLMWKGSLSLVNPDKSLSGEVNVQLRETFYDKAGNSGESSPVAIDIDTTHPTLSIDVEPKSLIKDSEAIITFTFSEAPSDFTADDIAVTAGLGTIKDLSKTDAEGKVWTATFTPSEGYTGSGSIQVKAESYTDAAGNKGQASEAVNVSVDTVAPTATLSINSDVLGPNTQSVGFTISFTEVPYQGNTPLTATQVRDLLSLPDSVKANLEISALTPKSNDEGNTTWTGTISFKQPASDEEALPDLKLDSDNLSVTVSDNFTDKAGNSGKTTPGTLKIDTIAPDVEIVSSEADDKFLNIQELSGDLVIKATTEATDVKSAQLVFADKSYEGTLDKESGQWSFTVPKADLDLLKNGSEYDIAVNLTDDVGNVGRHSHRVTIDNTAPSVTVDIERDALSTSHPESAFTITFTEKPFAQAQAGKESVALTAEQIKGLLSLGNDADKLTIMDWSNPSGDGLTWTGKISLTDSAKSGSLDKVKPNLSIATNSYYDQAGNPGSAGSDTVTIDTKVPTITLNGNLAGDGYLNLAEQEQALTLSGTTTDVEAGQSVIISFVKSDGSAVFDENNQAVTVTASVKENGSWIVDLPVAQVKLLPQGAITVKADVSDNAGNEATTAQETVTVDTVAPSTTISTVSGEDNTVDWAEKTSSGFDIKGTVSGIDQSGVAKGATVTLTFTDKDGQAITKDGKPLTITGTVGDNNQWSAHVDATDASLLKDGKVSASVTDVAGNTGKDNQDFTVAPPPMPVITDYIDTVDYVKPMISKSGAVGSELTIDGASAQIKGRYGETLSFTEITQQGKYGTLTVHTDGTWSYTVNPNASVGDTGKTVQDILQAEKSPLPDTFKVTDANGQEFQLLVNIDDRFAPTGQYSVSVLTSATAKEASHIKSSLQTGTLDGASKETPITEITSVTINGKSIQAKVGIYQEVPNEGAFQINADGSYFFEPYHNGSSFSFTARVGGEEKTASLSNINTTYSNDLLGTIKGTLVGVSDGEVTLRLYVNKQSKDDTAEVQYGPDSYPNGSDVKVTVTDGQWSISPKQLRQVLNDIWYADRLRGDDEIYLEVKMVDPVTGHTSEASTRYTFIADSQAPMAVQVGYQDATTSQTEHGVVTALIQGNLSLDKGIYANQGDAVKVFYNGQEVGTGTVGDFSTTVTGYRDIKITLNKDLPLNGEAFNPELVKVYVTDTAGNTGVSINDNSASERAVDSNMPKPVITAYLDNVGADGKAVEESAVQTIPNGGFTNDNNGGIKGTITIPDGGYSVDEIWLFFHGLGPYKITVPDEIKYAQDKPVTWEWEIKDTDHQFDQLTTTGKLAEGAINIMARAYNATQDKLSEASDIFTVYIDTRAPTVSIKVADSTLTLNETTQVTFTFDEKPQGFDENDIEVTGGKISDLKQSSTNPLKWTATFTPDPNTETTTASIKVKGASYTDVAGNNGKEGSSANIIIDTHKPENTMPPELSLQEDASWSDFSVSVKEGNLANVKVSVEHGQLNITVPSGVTITEGANGSSSLTLKGSDINTALASLKYQPNSHWQVVIN